MKNLSVIFTLLLIFSPQIWAGSVIDMSLVTGAFLTEDSETLELEILSAGSESLYEVKFLNEIFENCEGDSLNYYKSSDYSVTINCERQLDIIKGSIQLATVRKEVSISLRLSKDLELVSGKLYYFDHCMLGEYQPNPAIGMAPINFIPCPFYITKEKRRNTQFVDWIK